MAKMDSVSKMVSRGVKKSASVATKTVSGVAKVAQDTVSGVAKTTTTGTGQVVKKVQGLCNADSIIPCLTAITLIAYIVIVTPSTVLDLFSTKLGKSLSMTLVMVALLFDVKLGVMLGLAVILSISLASVNKDLYESFEEQDGAVVIPSDETSADDKEEKYAKHEKFKKLKTDFEDHESAMKKLKKDFKSHTHDIIPHTHDLGQAHLEDEKSEGYVDCSGTDCSGNPDSMMDYADTEELEVNEGFTSSGEVTGLDSTMCKFAPFVQES